VSVSYKGVNIFPVFFTMKMQLIVRRSFSNSSCDYLIYVYWHL